MLSSSYLSMISAQTRFRVCREEKPVSTFSGHALETENNPVLIQRAWKGGLPLPEAREGLGEGMRAENPPHPDRKNNAIEVNRVPLQNELSAFSSREPYTPRIKAL
jgi:hypothetical protein